MLLGERQRAYAKSDLDAGKGSLLLCRVDGKQAARLSVPMTGHTATGHATKYRYNGSAGKVFFSCEALLTKGWGKSSQVKGWGK